MNLLFSTEYEINISLSLCDCQKIRNRILNRKCGNACNPETNSITLSVDEKDWQLRHNYFRNDILGRSLMYRSKKTQLQYFKSINFRLGEQEIIYEDYDQLQVIFPLAQWLYFLDSFLSFAEGYWDFFLILPQIRKAITFASHDSNENDISLLIDAAIVPPLPYHGKAIQALLEKAKKRN